MKAGMKERATARLAVRKANRIAAVDREMRARRIRCIVVVLVTIGILATEGFVLNIAKRDYDREMSVKIAEDISIQLSLIGSALREGNKAQYNDARKLFDADLQEFQKYTYVDEEVGRLMTELVKYNEVLNASDGLISDIIDLRVTIQMLSNITEEAKNSEIDVARLYTLSKTYVDFRDGVMNIEAVELKDIKEILHVYAKDIIPTIDSSAVCIGICSENILREKRDTITRMTDDAIGRVRPLSEQISEPFDPNKLVVELGVYCDL